MPLRRIAMKAGALDHVITVISHASSPKLHLQREDCERVNPKWSMVARVMVNLLSNVEVIPRLMEAKTTNDLKAIMFVDEYLSIVKNRLFKQQIRELLAAPEVSFETIETFAALSFARDAIWECEEHKPLDENNILYSIEAAAAQLNVEPEQLCYGIWDGEVTADLYLTRAEIERLICQKTKSQPVPQP
jgi:hypothetical protein